MKKRLTPFLIAALFLLGGCGSTVAEVVEPHESEIQSVEVTSVESKASQASEAEAVNVTIEEKADVTFTDALGREVTVGDANRVVTLLGSFCDIWTIAGGNVVATVKDSWTAFDLDLSEDVINVGSFLEPNLEKIISTEPDFVIASAGTDAQIELLETIENAGISIAYFDVDDYHDYIDMLDICTRITGETERFEEYGKKVEEEIEVQKSRADGSQPTVLFIRAAASSVKVKGSSGTVGGEVLADLGCINIADSDRSLLEDLSMEAIILADPDYIFVTTQGEDTEAALANVEELLKSNPAWNSLSAVQNGNYYEIEKELYNSKPNARWAESYRKLADILYGNKG